MTPSRTPVHLRDAARGGDCSAQDATPTPLQRRKNDRAAKTPRRNSPRRTEDGAYPAAPHATAPLHKGHRTSAPRAFLYLFSSLYASVSMISPTAGANPGAPTPPSGGESGCKSTASGHSRKTFRKLFHYALQYLTFRSISIIKREHESDEFRIERVACQQSFVHRYTAF